MILNEASSILHADMRSIYHIDSQFQRTSPRGFQFIFDKDQLSGCAAMFQEVDQVLPSSSVTAPKLLCISSTSNLLEKRYAV